MRTLLLLVAAGLAAAAFVCWVMVDVRQDAIASHGQQPPRVSMCNLSTPMRCEAVDVCGCMMLRCSHGTAAGHMTKITLTRTDPDCHMRCGHWNTSAPRCP